MYLILGESVENGGQSGDSDGSIGGVGTPWQGEVDGGFEMQLGEVWLVK